MRFSQAGYSFGLHSPGWEVSFALSLCVAGLALSAGQKASRLQPLVDGQGPNTGRDLPHSSVDLTSQFLTFGWHLLWVLA